DCGKVIEFYSAELEALQDVMAEKYGFKLTHHSLRILGVCSDCQNKEIESQQAASGAQPRIRVKSVVGN
ncbi:MAG TPA: transcriptional repressor, partial [Pyrinomonadaceae bacterium]|nr:transcriptional repressor [Pyrinomonadaceae bacterium]